MRRGVRVVHVPPGGAGRNVCRQLRLDADRRLVVDRCRGPRVVEAAAAASAHPRHTGVGARRRRERVVENDVCRKLAAVVSRRSGRRVARW